MHIFFHPCFKDPLKRKELELRITFLSYFLVFIFLKHVQDSFTIISLQEVDMGLYMCTVSAWSVNSQGDLEKLTEKQGMPHSVRWVTKRKEAPFVIT